MVGVGGEGQHDLFGDAGSLVARRLSEQVLHKVRARVCPGVKLGATDLDRGGNIAIDAAVAATSVGVAGQRPYSPACPRGV